MGSKRADRSEPELPEFEVCKIGVIARYIRSGRVGVCLPELADGTRGKRAEGEKMKAGTLPADAISSRRLADPTPSPAAPVEEDEEYGDRGQEDSKP